MNILLCHERFLFRFGADRVLILLGRGLKELGHRITVMANRYDSEVVQSFSQAIACPLEGTPYLDLNEFTSDWIRGNWSRLFAPDKTPDVIIVGGWPFFSAISFFREVCNRVVFLDFGAVPTYGYSEGTRITLEKLCALRRRHLPDVSLIVAISQFLADSQSRPDSGNTVPVQSILLGADHMEATAWPTPQVEFGSEQGSALETIRTLKLQGKKVLLCLGRWEPGCYKNSQAAFDVMKTIRKRRSDCVLLVLEHPSHVEIPASLRDAIVPIGFPADHELMEVMKQADLGVSFSLWEGFNLPLAEMQWLGQPALAFDLAAHPEVVAHPWYLCQNATEMEAKAEELLAGRGPEPAEMAESLRAFRTHFRWQRFIDEFSQSLNALPFSEKWSSRNPELLLIDVTNSARDTANSGVVRVTRRLGRTLQELGHDPIFVIWEENTTRYVLPTSTESELLARFNGPISNEDRLSPPKQRIAVDDILTELGGSGRWLLIPEIKTGASLRHVCAFAQHHDLRTAAVFYDAIPVLRPDLCSGEIRDNHGHYMRALADCDLIIPISHFSAQCLTDFWRNSDVVSSCRLVTDVLPGQSGSARPIRVAPDRRPAVRPNILCVSTLEPRKNHRNLIQACLCIRDKYPELEFSLTLVGNRYAGALEIAAWIEDVSASNPWLKWLGTVDDATLARLYAECAFTVYPSVIEGFGLPILESIWHGRPCICFNQGVMAELAEAGGCLITDVNDPLRLAETIYQLASDESLRLKLSRAALARPLKTWNNYVMDLTQAMAQHPPSATPRGHSAPCLTVDDVSSASWQAALYPGCLCDKWQMNDSERMALTGLLSRHTPHCSIEVGTYHGGSLSLISQYSKIVFSIDIDESLRSRFDFANVTFLTGRSNTILPHLLRELDQARMPLQFVLIDGDHSAKGVRDDITCLLDYVPKEPLFVVLHDSFNPECRKGMLEAGWHTSSYCHWVDLDFIPGRLVEHPGPFHGQLWGGLAAAYFLPVARQGALQMRRTAEQMFQTLAAPRAAANTA